MSDRVLLAEYKNYTKGYGFMKEPYGMDMAEVLKKTGGLAFKYEEEFEPNGLYHHPKENWWEYQPASKYFDKNDKGFAIPVGTLKVYARFIGAEYVI